MPLLESEELKIIEKKVPEGETPFWKYWDEYVITRAEHGKSPYTVLSVRDTLRIILRKTNITSIEQANSVRFCSQELRSLQSKRGFSPTTRNTYLKNLNSYFIWLERNEYIEKNNIRKIEKSTEKRPEQPTLSESSIREVVGFLGMRKYRSERERARNIFFISLLKFTGARPAELLNLSIGCVRKEDGMWRVAIDGKKQKGRLRYYSLPSWLMKLYFDYIELRAEIKDHDFIFVSRTGAPWTSSGSKKMFQKLSKEIGFRVNQYAFRRHVATELQRRGVELIDIQNYLGHTRASTTQLYIARSCCLTDNAGKVMDKIHSNISIAPTS